MKPFDPSSDPRILRLVSHLYGWPPATFLYIQRRILLREPEDILADYGKLPFDQIALQSEAQLAEHFDHAVTPLVVRYALNGLRRRLQMNSHGIAPRGSEGKRTLADSLDYPLFAQFSPALFWADHRIHTAFLQLPESDAVFEKFFRKHEELLLGVIRSWMRVPDGKLTEDIAQSAWQAGMLLFDPQRQWSFKFFARIARNLLREEWNRRRRWGEIAYLDSLEGGPEVDDSWFDMGPMPAQAFALAAATEEPVWLQRLDLAEEALRVVMSASGAPIHRAMYVATALLGLKRENIVATHAQTMLIDFVDMIELMFTSRSRLTEEKVAELFAPLRRDLLRPCPKGLDEEPAPDLPPEGARLVGAARIEEFFRHEDGKRRARAISDWAENVKRQVWAQASRPGTTLFRLLKEADPGWKGPPRRVLSRTRTAANESRDESEARPRARRVPNDRRPRQPALPQSGAPPKTARPGARRRPPRR